MRSRLIIDGNSVYEIDDECLKCREEGRGSRGNTNSGKILASEAGREQKER
ncbi:MAG TPA: hypothetical protein H9740_10950 [Candidatus Hungatella pullicola]|nr:hypothetical protein [Candidatus Hungatella pullicola]